MQGYTVCCVDATTSGSSETASAHGKRPKKDSEAVKTALCSQRKKIGLDREMSPVEGRSRGYNLGYGLGGMGSSGGSGGLPFTSSTRAPLAKSQAQKGDFERIEADFLDTLAQPLQNEGSSEAATIGKLRKRARAKWASVPLATQLAELRTDLEQSYRNTVYCSQIITQEDGQLKTHYCGNRWCILCNRIRTARLINGYEPVLKGWDDKWFVTLTLENCSGEALPGVLDGMLRAWQSSRSRLNRTLGLRLVALRKIECTSRRDDDYHPHIHAVVQGRATAEALVDAWLKFAPKWTGRDAQRAAQDLKECDEGALLELFKYFTKLSTNGKRIPAARLDVIFQAMKGRRVFQPCGFTLSEADDLEEIEVEGSTPAISQLDQDVLWWWDQLLADWVDEETGECLTGHSPPEDERGRPEDREPEHHQPNTSLGSKRSVPLGISVS